MAHRDASLPRSLPVLLSLVAGYVDSCTFLALFGLFVAQVTGSFVFAGVQIVAPEQRGLVKFVAIPAFFTACVVTALIVESLRRRGRSALAVSLALETLLLGGLFACWFFGAPFRGPGAVAAVLASVFGLSAMGVQSALVRLFDRAAPSTNVMTTNTTQFAIDVAEIMLTWRASRRAPADAASADAHTRAMQHFHRMWPILLGFLAGTVTGALAYASFDLWCILAPIALAGGLAIWAGLRA